MSPVVQVESAQNVTEDPTESQDTKAFMDLQDHPVNRVLLVLQSHLQETQAPKGHQGPMAIKDREAPQDP